jgi:hypothetical protein
MEPTWDETSEVSDAPSWDDTVAEEDVIEQIPPTEPKGPWFEAGPLRIEKSPMDVDWVAAAKEKWNDPNPYAAAGTENPLLWEAAAPAIASGISKVGGALKSGAEAFATSPVPQKISDATNVTGMAKSYANKVFDAISSKLPQAVQTTGDLASGLAGRKVAYSNPFTAIPQGISDTAKATQFAQKGTAWLLDNAPEKLGPFLQVLKNAAAESPAALATTDFLLSQKDAEYQKLKKKLHTQ